MKLSSILLFKKSPALIPILAALSAYAGPTPLPVVPIESLPLDFSTK